MDRMAALPQTGGAMAVDVATATEPQVERAPAVAWGRRTTLTQNGIEYQRMLRTGKSILRAKAPPDFEDLPSVETLLTGERALRLAPAKQVEAAAVSPAPAPAVAPRTPPNPRGEASPQASPQAAALPAIAPAAAAARSGVLPSRARRMTRRLHVPQLQRRTPRWLESRWLTRAWRAAAPQVRGTREPVQAAPPRECRRKVSLLN